MAENAEDCPVCLMTFDDPTRRPRNLPCGHTFCTPCLNRVEKRNQKKKKKDWVTCPTCRDEHAVPEAGQFPINYALEALMKSVRESSQNGAAVLSTAMLFKLQELESKVLATIRTCQDRQAQLNQYQTTLKDLDERQQNLEDQLQALVDRLQALVDQSKIARELVRQEVSQVADKKEKEQQWQQHILALLQTLLSVSAELEVGVESVNVARCIDEERQKVKECRRRFPDLHTITTISKVWQASSAALEAATTFQAALETVGAPAGAAGDASLIAASDSTITDRVEVLLTPTLKAKDLLSLTQPARSLLQASLVFAVHQEEGYSWYSRISLEDGRLYLYSLQYQALPPRAVTVQVDEVIPAAPPCLVFLDFAWPGSDLRRVLIRLSSDTPRSRHFLLLCTGQKGPCYANTRLWGVWYKGRSGECVCGGDYEYNNGKGGAALIPDLGKGAYLESRQAGAVWGWWGDPAQGAIYGIITRDRKDDGVRGPVLGMVVAGLEGVAAAAQHSPIEDVTVVDCGVVLGG